MDSNMFTHGPVSQTEGHEQHQMPSIRSDANTGYIQTNAYDASQDNLPSDVDPMFDGSYPSTPGAVENSDGTHSSDTFSMSTQIENVYQYTAGPDAFSSLEYLLTIAEASGPRINAATGAYFVDTFVS